MHPAPLTLGSVACAQQRVALLRRIAAAMLLVLALVLARAAQAQTPGGQDDLAFTEYSPLATTAQLLGRMMTPLWSARAFAIYAAKGEAPPTYTVDLPAERFAIHVPPGAPPAEGYGLIVFIPPWPDAVVPRRWRKALDESGVIFVTAANSGNDAPEIPRRMALALHAYANVSARYHVDPRRVYVGGFSGGSRVALRLAINYPDVFRGALLDGGSDNIGSFLVPLPDAALLRRAQEHLRLVYLYGGDDQPNASRAQYSMASARDLCIFDVSRLVMFHRAHEPADAPAWREGLGRLEQPSRAAPDGLAACRARVERELADAIANATALFSQGKWQEARKAVEELDARFSHLAAPTSVELSAKMRTR